MLMKTIQNLSIDDILKKKDNAELSTLKQIVKGDDGEQNNYGFSGFYVMERVVGKMFNGANGKIFTYNDEK